MNHIMLDLETLSSASDAAIVAIGAVRFDPKERNVGNREKSGTTFYRVISFKSAQRSGGRIDGDTIAWWFKQTDAARTALIGDDSVLIETALIEFSNWVREVPCDGMWGNGADFDNVILQNAYSRLGKTPPWKYSLSRCYRTIKSLYPEIKLVREGTHHNALDDAISQARHLCAMLGGN